MSEPSTMKRSNGGTQDTLSLEDIGFPPPNILVVDDEPVVLRALEKLLKRAGARVLALENGLEAVSTIQEEHVDVALVDIRMPHIDGMKLLAKIKKSRPDTEVVMITAYATIETAVQAIKLGAYDYLTKPFDNVTDVVAVVRRAVERCRLHRRNKELEEAIVFRTSFEGMVGSAPSMREVFDIIESVAYSSSTVLIQGESGTGKELVARALHKRSPRKEGPFVAINCTAVPETLLESELFGHVKGAFTGAISHKKGLFEAANGGTLFLDEIGDLPLPLQGKLLRVLEEGEIRHVGSNITHRIDGRIVAATNLDLEKTQREGRFRKDLFYRLNVIPIDMPPLRERASDIPVLAHHFLRRFSTRDRKSIDGLAQEAVDALSGYYWPGNVRELENVIERASVLCRDPIIEPRHLPRHLVESGKSGFLEDGSPLGGLAYAKAKEIALAAFEKRYLECVLQKTKGNISESARLAAMDRSNFRRIMKRYGIDASRYLDDASS